jgi:hypothetical protein
MYSGVTAAKDTVKAELSVFVDQFAPAAKKDVFADVMFSVLGLGLSLLSAPIFNTCMFQVPQLK